MKSLPRLSVLLLACIESINQSVNRYDEDKDMVAMEAPFMYNDEEIGTIKYTLHQRIICPASKRTYDYPDFSAEIQCIALYPYVDSLYSLDGNRLLNIEKQLNKMLNDKYKF